MSSEELLKTAAPLDHEEKTPLLPAGMLLGFGLVTILFPLWGFANDITNPLVKAFKDIFLISNTQSSLVQTAFYGGYATMAIPAAIFIRRFSYKSGILIGLLLYALGAFIFIPAGMLENFWLFLIALYILTFGLAFLETTANPYILSMGSEKTATRRLNLAQAFNPLGSLIGMVVASQFILANLDVNDYRSERDTVYQHAMANAQTYASLATDEEKASFLTTFNAEQKAKSETTVPLTTADMENVLTLQKNANNDPWKLQEGMDKLVTDDLYALPQTDTERYETTKTHDLVFVRIPYVTIGCVVLAIFFIFLISRLPDTSSTDRSIRFFETFGRLVKNPAYIGGVVAQTFYIGAQIMCWTYIIHYATTLLGMSASDAQNYNIVAMIIFCCSRFICTYMLRFISPGKLLLVLAIGGMATSLGAILLEGMLGLYSLIAISACMSLMFPTIYGIALDGLGEDAKLGSAGLIFAIVGGALMPPLQGWIIDVASVRASFYLPFVCFIVVAIYGVIAIIHRRRTATY